MWCWSHFPKIIFTNLFALWIKEMHFTHGSHKYLVHFGYILYFVIKQAAFGEHGIKSWFVSAVVQWLRVFCHMESSNITLYWDNTVNHECFCCMSGMGCFALEIPCRKHNYLTYIMLTTDNDKIRFWIEYCLFQTHKTGTIHLYSKLWGKYLN